jgi:hypothetical protein
MAAGSWTVFNIAKKKLADGTFDLNTNTYKMALTTSAQALAATFVGTSTDCRYADLTNEVAAGGGYTTGGKTLAATWVQAVGTITFDVDDQAWTSSTITARYAVIYDDTTANKNLVCFCLLDSTPADVSTTAGTLTITINASGVFTLA